MRLPQTAPTSVGQRPCNRWKVKAVFVISVSMTEYRGLGRAGIQQYARQLFA